MDAARVLVPIELTKDNKNVRCKVYFDGCFSGFCIAPAKLFSDQDGWSKISYRLIPDRPPAPPPVNVEREDGGRDGRRFQRWEQE
jgi:hypothetical protein